MGGNACNGWSFWSLEEAPSTTQDTSQVSGDGVHEGTQTQEAMLRDEEQEKDWDEEPEDVMNNASAVSEELVPAKKRIFRVPNQRGVAQEETRYYCHTCGESIATSSEETPQVCPEGHPAK